ncbi:hypothetical protein [Nocardioides sp. R-C-SC26]|uniref:hypothetical protein n=1 Tax=Nocardioides sp. R-C-SC26 TaxID=2870414 RepID=UPI001E2D8AE2|nr:hypothetical protein [Nocardioides sp. R-C-SC26]
MVFRRTPKLLGPGDLPEGFAYPDGVVERIRDYSFRDWEWLQGARLREAAAQLWQAFPREFVPFALRKGTSFVACLDAARVGPQGFEVVTVDVRDPGRGLVQHLPDFPSWFEAARAEAEGGRGGGAPTSAPPVPGPSGPAPQPGAPARPGGYAAGGPSAPGAPGEPVGFEEPGGYGGPESFDSSAVGSWVPPERGQCACVHHLEDFLMEVVPFGKTAPSGLEPRRVSDLVMSHEIDARPGFPGPQLEFRKRPVGPFHWEVWLGQGARLHLDEGGRVDLELWLMRNPNVGAVVWPQRQTLHLQGPHLCTDGVLTLIARALLDDRVRRRK